MAVVFPTQRNRRRHHSTFGAAIYRTIPRFSFFARKTLQTLLKISYPRNTIHKGMLIKKKKKEETGTSELSFYYFR